ncbi:MAG: hypothetical protein ACFCVK_21675 [Acidimicrobiales bacterium]
MSWLPGIVDVHGDGFERSLMPRAGVAHDGDRVGLVLRSPWLEAATARVFADDRVGSGDDPVRRKNQLHLSLAYGVDDLGPYASLARELVRPPAAAGWSIGLWERSTGDRWHRLCATGDRPKMEPPADEESHA